MDRFIGIGRSIKYVGESNVTVIYIVFSEFTISLDDFHPDIHGFYLIPSVVLSLFTVLHYIEQTRLKVLEYHYEGIHCPSAHNEVVD